jgi:uncharacterized protein
MKQILTGIAALALSFAAFGTAANAQQLKVATGGEKGTYAQMFRELRNSCQAEMKLLEVPTSGSVENVDLLMGNQVNAGIVQSDVLFFRSRNENMSMLKTLVTMHPEEVHLITRADGKVEGSKSILGFTYDSGTRVILNDFQELSGRSVAAVGGSVWTAKAMTQNSGVAFQIVEAKSNPEALDMLRASQVDAVVMVIGRDAQVIKELGAEFKLLPITGMPLEMLTKNIYDPTKLTYTNLSQSTGVSTVKIQSLFITRDYKTEKMKNGLLALRECIKEKAPEIAESTGTHPKWQEVNPSNPGKWPVYGAQ